MNLGDQVVVLDDVPEGTLATVTALHEPDYIEFQLADGRFFTAIESSLSPARSV
ncbi:hypothetical protein [Amycolatopsis sp. NPDC051128]|uniref:hypothetical protein n=1 Tax=Amycolatopsis sp. NPDC051128 TaxID=3155412 RepID=UPI003436A982